MSQSTALATIPSGVIPKPTKAELLKATAEAMAQESRENYKADKAAYDKNEAKARMVLLNKIKPHLSKAFFSRCGNAIELRFPGYSAAEQTPEVLAIVKEYSDAVALVPVRKCQSAKDILEELKKKAATATGDGRIQQILSDPKTRKALIQMGNAILDA